MRILKPLPGTLPMPGRNIDGDWPMNSLGDEIFDRSGNGNIGNFIGDTAWLPGKYGSCLSFDGAGDRVNLGSGINFTGANSFSVVVWFNATTSGAAGYDHFIVGTGLNNGWYLRLESNAPVGRVVVKVDDGTDDAFVFSIGGGYDDGKWHQLVLVWDAPTNQLEGFIDVRSFGTDIQANIDNLLDTIWLGGDVETGSVNYDYEGRIDGLLIVNRALSASEVALLYREPFYRYPENRIFAVA